MGSRDQPASLAPAHSVLMAESQLRRQGGALRVPVTAPMLGKILRFAVSPGDRVQEDDTVLVMEAMKMEIEVVATATGTLAEFVVAPGDAVDADAVLGYIDEA